MNTPNIHITFNHAIDSAASGISLAVAIHSLPILAHLVLTHLGMVVIAPMVVSAVAGLGLPLISSVVGE